MTFLVTRLVDAAPLDALPLANLIRALPPTYEPSTAQRQRAQTASHTSVLNRGFMATFQQCRRTFEHRAMGCCVEFGQKDAVARVWKIRCFDPSRRQLQTKKDGNPQIHQFLMGLLQVLLQRGTGHVRIRRKKMADKVVAKVHKLVAR